MATSKDIEFEIETLQSLLDQPAPGQPPETTARYAAELRKLRTRVDIEKALQGQASTEDSPSEMARLRSQIDIELARERTAPPPQQEEPAAQGPPLPGGQYPEEREAAIRKVVLGSKSGRFAAQALREHPTKPIDLGQTVQRQAIAGAVSGLPFIGGAVSEKIAPPPRSAALEAARGIASVPTNIAAFTTAAGWFGKVRTLTTLAKTYPKLSNMVSWGLAASSLNALNIDDRELAQRATDAGWSGLESAALATFVVPGAKRVQARLEAGKGTGGQPSRWEIAGRFGVFAGLRTIMAPEGGTAPIELFGPGHPVANAVAWDGIVAAVYSHGKPKVGDIIPVAVGRPIAKDSRLGSYDLGTARVLNKETKFHRTVYTLELPDGERVEWKYGDPIRSRPGPTQNLQDNVTILGQHLKVGDAIQWNVGKTGKKIGFFRGYFKDPNDVRQEKLLVEVPDKLGAPGGQLEFVSTKIAPRILDEKARREAFGAEGQVPPATPTGETPPPVPRADMLIGVPGEEPPVPAPFGKPAPPSTSEMADPRMAPAVKAPTDQGDHQLNAIVQNAIIHTGRRVDAVGGIPIFGETRAEANVGFDQVNRVLETFSFDEIRNLRALNLRFFYMQGTLPGHENSYAWSDNSENFIVVDTTFKEHALIPGRQTKLTGTQNNLLTLIHEIQHQLDHVKAPAAPLGIEYSPETAAYHQAVGWQPLDQAPARTRLNLLDFFSNGTTRTEWTLVDGSKMDVVISARDGWWRQTTDAERSDRNLLFFRGTVAEDTADTMAWFAENPDTLKQLDPIRFDAILKFLQPRIVRGLTSEEGQLLLLPPQVRPGAGPAVQPAARAEAGQPPAEQQIALPLQARAEMAKPPRDPIADLTRAIEAEKDPAQRAKMQEVLDNLVKPVSDMIQKTAEALEVDPGALHNKVFDDVMRMAMRGESQKSVRTRIISRARDLRRQAPREVSGGDVAGSLLGEGKTEPGLVAGGAQTQRVKGKLLGAIQNLKGSPEGQKRIAEALAKIQDVAVRETLMAAGGVDINGRPVGNAIPLGEAAKKNGVTLRQIQAAIRTAPDGTFIVKEMAGQVAKDKKAAAQVLGIKPDPDPVGALIAKAREIDAALTKTPNDPNLQRRAREVRGKLGALAKQGESLTPEQRTALKAVGYDPDAVQAGMDAEHPDKPVAEAPPGAAGVKFPSDNNVLAGEWRRLVDLLKKQAVGPKAAAFTAAIARTKALEAEMRRRGLPFEPSGGFPAGKAPKGGHPKRPRKVPEPEFTPTDYIAETVPELDPWAIEHARARGDYTPTRVIIRRASDKVIIGNYSSRPLRPQFWAQNRYRIESLGFMKRISEGRVGPFTSGMAKLAPGAADPTPEISGAFRYKVVDRISGEELIFTPDQLKRFMAGQFIPGQTVDPDTGEMLPSARDIAEDIRTTPPDQLPPSVKLGTHNLQDVEFMNLDPHQQVAHIAKMADEAQSGDAAWGAFNRYSGLVLNHPNRARDLEAIMSHVRNRWGPPGPRFAGNHELLQILNKIESSYQNDQRAGVLHWKDYESIELGGTGKAYDPAKRQADTESFIEIQKRLTRPTEPSGDEIAMPDDGRLTWLAHISMMGPTRQNYFFGHPVAADLHLKARFADRHAAIRVSNYNDRMKEQVGDTTLPERLAIQMYLDGRYEAHKTLDVPTRLIHDALNGKTPFGGRDIRVALDKLDAIFGGRVPTEQILVPELTPRLKEKAHAIRQVMNEIADEAGLPRNRRIEEYWPHLFNKVGFGELEYYDLPFDMNVGSEVFFRFFNKRKHPNATGYEIDLLETFDVYLRGAMRKAAFDPLVREFNSPQVRNVLPNKQREYLQKWLRHIVGEPSTDDQLIAKAAQSILGEAPSWGFVKMLRRAALASDRPAYAIAQTLRGTQFLAKLGLNFGFMTVNLTQAPLMYLMRHRWSGYIKVLADSGIFRTSAISQYFAASHLSGDVRRSELSLQMQKQRGYISQAANLIASAVQGTEIINRRQSFTAGFKVAKEAGLMDGDAVAAGIIESDLTQFNTSKTGRLPLMKSQAGSVAFQFLPYTVEMANLIGRELHGATGTAGKDRAIQAWTRLTKLTMAAHLLGGINAHIGPLVQYMEMFNRAVFGEEIDAEFMEMLHMLDVFSMDYLLGSVFRGRPFELGTKINPIQLLNKLGTGLFGPTLGAAKDVIERGLGAPMAPNLAQQTVRNLPVGVAAERAFGEAIQRYGTEPVARALGARPSSAKLKQGRDPAERLLGREPVTGPGKFRSDPTALAKVMRALGLTSKQQ